MILKVSKFMKVTAGAALVVCALPAHALKLTPQDVVDQVLGKSDRVEEIQFTNQLAYTALERAKGRFDFNLTGSANYEYKEAEALSGLANPLDKTYKIGGSVTKATRLGNTWTLGYEHVEQTSVLNPVIATTRTPRVAFDAVTLGLRQALWRNSFGYADRLALAAEGRRVTEADLRRQESLEELTLESMRLYWDCFVAKVQLQDAVAAREKYNGLVGTVRRKSRFGLQRGGEMAQVLAEFEDADQKAKRASTEYLRLIDRLKTLIKLQIPANEDLEFVVGQEVPPLPRLAAKDIETLRSIRNIKSEGETARVQLDSVSTLAAPQLDLVANATSTGLESDFDRSYAEMTGGTKPTYLVGFEFNTPLDSSLARADLANARVELSRKELQLRQQRLALLDQARELELKVKSSFEIAKSAIEAESLRSRTVREQESEYRTGRLALIELIRSYNSYFDSQSRRTRAIGDYHISLNEYAASRDELVREK